MENKTKEQLWLECYEYLSDYEKQNSVKVLKEMFNDGYDSRQPEIDRLKAIISGKTFHDEAESLKAEIKALKETIKDISAQLVDLVIKNPPKQTKP